VRKLKTTVVGLALCLLAGPALGQEASETERNAARQLGEEGIALYEQGNHAAAAEKLDRAYAILQVQTLGLWSARALAKTGKLVEASERYQAVLRLPVPADAPAVITDAIQQSRSELAPLKARIPTLELHLQGAAPEEVTLTVDGQRFESKLIGIPMALNPGDRVVELRRGEEVVTRTVTLAEGAHEQLVIELAAQKAVPVAGAPAPAPSAGATEPVADSGASSDGSLQRTLGWVGLGVGGAGLLFGTITGVMTMGKRSDLRDACEGERCPVGTQDDIDAYGTYHTLSTVGFIVGAVGVVGGGALLLTAPSSPPPQTAHIEPYVGLGSAGIHGVF